MRRASPVPTRSRSESVDSRNPHLNDSDGSRRSAALSSAQNGAYVKLRAYSGRQPTPAPPTPGEDWWEACAVGLRGRTRRSTGRDWMQAYGQPSDHAFLTLRPSHTSFGSYV